MSIVLRILTIGLGLKLVSSTSTNRSALNQTSGRDMRFNIAICQNTAPEFLSDDQKKKCCSSHSSNFRRRWYVGGQYLTSYLTTLRKLGCVEFEKECSKPLYNFTPFTKLVYLNFCNRTQLITQCTEVLRDVYDFSKVGLPTTTKLTGNLSVDEEIWRNLTASLRPRRMSLDTLNIPCVQIALFDRPSGGVGRFHEIAQPFTLFCPISWVGYDIDTAMERDVSPWTGWSVRCKSSIIICFIVTAVLIVAVIVCNMLVLAVYTTSHKLRNSQAIYKISVAASDLLSGLLVIPNMIIFAYLIYMVPRKMGNVIPSESDVVRRLPGGHTGSILSHGHIKAVGFLTTFTLTISLYTLLTASFDRFRAIFRPLTYDKTRAKRHAKIICLVTWIFAALISTLPFMIPTLQYHLTPGLMVNSVGSTASILLMVAFGIPLVLVCVTNSLIFCAAKRHARVRQKLRQSMVRRDRKDDDMERRLSKVLGLMVGVFTLCVLPVIFTTMSAAAFRNIYFWIPEKLDPDAVVIYDSVGYSFGLLLLSNSLWNCFIYSWRGHEFRKAAKSLRLIKIAGSTVESALSSIRRLSEVTLVYYRRKSSASTDVHLSSMQTTRVSTNTENMSSSQSDSRSPMSNEHCHSPAPDRNENHAEDYPTELNSFAINAGADRFYVSVMEDIKET